MMRRARTDSKVAPLLAQAGDQSSDAHALDFCIVRLAFLFACLRFCASAKSKKLF
jgi:hypothetical protein